ncbi:putative jacalin-like lectin domain-containing protein [Helianthus annuus]|uniref:Jacalin-like lectin domain-containing protein n=1 Tax=Helianthus annuus TaxID=4232 RepID=A0A9K3HJ45_HELAN|nr:putative jacalin-like lectin domain-containing protein [Helianthus annuus]
MKFKTVAFDYSNNEYLTSISGEYDNGRLVSIVFGTNKKKYGPFGRTGSKSDETSYDDFCFEFGPRNCLEAFMEAFLMDVCMLLECMSNNIRHTLMMRIRYTTFYTKPYDVLVMVVCTS